MNSTQTFDRNFKGVGYCIINKETMHDIKLSVDIGLEREVSEKFLKKFALKLRKEEPIKYDRIFIGYYLPGMVVNAGAWASSHFNPQLEVMIYE